MIIGWTLPNSYAIDTALRPENPIAAEQEHQPQMNNQEMMEQIDFNEGKKPEIAVLHQVSTLKIELPQCQDENMLAVAKDYIKAVLLKNKDESTMYRRRRHFVLHNLDKFAEENVADYKTMARRPISDMIATIRMNEGIAEENIRLCKNQSMNQYASQIYLLIYPLEEGYKIHVINLLPETGNNHEIYFVYTNET